MYRTSNSVLVQILQKNISPNFCSVYIQPQFEFSDTRTVLAVIRLEREVLLSSCEVGYRVIMAQSIVLTEDSALTTVNIEECV